MCLTHFSFYSVLLLADVISHAAPTLKTVVEELNKVSCKTYAIGIQLGIPFDKLQSFKMLPSDEIFPAIVNYWLEDNTDVEVTWNSIVAVLKSDSVDEVGHANRIHKKFCQSEENLGTCSVPTY